MSVVFQPLRSDAAAGSVGDTTYRLRGRATYASVRTTSVYTSTPARDLTSAVAAALSSTWSTLDASARQSWHVWAMAHLLPDRFAHLRPISGFNWFCRLGSVRLRIGELPIELPAPAPAWPVHLALNCQPDGPGVGAAQLPDYPGPWDSMRLDLRFQPVLSPGRKPLYARSLHYSYVTPESQYVFFTVPGTGRRPLWLRYVHAATGHLSPPQLWDLTWI